MLCYSCHSQISNDSQFCPNCGTRFFNIDEKCKICGQPLDNDAVFCSKCGNPVGQNTADDYKQTILINPTEKNCPQLVQAKCSNCAASLSIDPSSYSAICPCCGTTYIISNNSKTRTNNSFKKNTPDFIIVSGELTAYRGSSKDVIIPDSVSTIGKEAFRGLSITSVVIPSSVVHIKDYAFCDCINLQSIAIPNSISKISPYTFKGCISLKNVAIPDSVTSIASFAFDGCTQLSEVIIPDSVMDIHLYAFRGCKNTRIIWPASYASKQLSKLRMVAIMENKEFGIIPRSRVIPSGTMISLLYDGEFISNAYWFCEANYMNKYNVKRNPVTNYNYCVNMDIQKAYSSLASLFDKAGINKDIIQTTEVRVFGKDCGSVKNGKVPALLFQIYTD